MLLTIVGGSTYSKRSKFYPQNRQRIHELLQECDEDEEIRKPRQSLPSNSHARKTYTLHKNSKKCMTQLVDQISSTVSMSVTPNIEQVQVQVCIFTIFVQNILSLKDRWVRNKHQSFRQNISTISQSLPKLIYPHQSVSKPKFISSNLVCIHDPLSPKVIWQKYTLASLLQLYGAA